MKRLLVLITFICFTSFCNGQEILGTFVAMEYRGMSNLIYQVYVTKQFISGIKVNGYISVKNPMGIGYSVPENELNDPEAYINPSMKSKYSGVNPISDTILNMDRENFIINRKEVEKVYNNPKKKWGMGYYPYSGRIIIIYHKTTKSKQSVRDLILVGHQNAGEILNFLHVAYEE